MVDNYSVNVPDFDDFSYLEYTLKLNNSQGIISFFNELLLKHNGHGVLTAKVIFYLDYLLEGEINFRHLILLSTFLVIAIFFFFIWLLNKNSIPTFFSIPIALILFSPMYHENILWAAATWQYIASFSLCFVTYILLTRKGKSAFLIAILLGFITTYTNGNGIIGFILGFIIILPQKNYRRLSLWLISIILTAIVYYSYSSPGLGTSNNYKIIPFFTTLLSFMGAATFYLRLNMNDLIVTGVILLIVYTVVLIRYLIKQNKNIDLLYKKPENLALLAIIAWLFLTGIGVAFTRGIEQFAIVQRYMIYSVMNLIVLYVLILLISPDRYRIIIGLVGIAVGVIFQFCALLYKVPDCINSRNSFWADIYNLKNHTHVSAKVEVMKNPYTRARFKEALQKKIYVFPKSPIPTDNQTLLNITKPKIDHLTRFTIKTDTLNSYSGILITSISNDRITIDESHPNNSIYVALKDEKTNKIHLMPARPTPNLNRLQFLRHGNYYNPGIQASVFQDNVSSGKYTIGWLTCQNQSISLTFTNQEVEIGKAY